MSSQRENSLPDRSIFSAPSGESTPPPSGSMNRLEAIARGEAVSTVVHDECTTLEMRARRPAFRFWYGLKQALYDIEMGMPHGRITAIIGPSGCGKSTLLRSINRLNDLLDDVRNEGDILLNGDSIYGRSVDVIELRKAHGNGVPEVEPFPDEHLRERRVLAARRRSSASARCSTKCASEVSAARLSGTK
jgi:phosphate transport system ATP-binding protein